MRKISAYFGVIAAAALTLVSCAKEANDPNYKEEIIKEGIPFEIVANPATKTTIDGLQTQWAADDGINLFHAVAGSTTYTSDGKFSIAAADLASGTFKGTVAEALASGSFDWYAFYPYVSTKDSPASTTKGYTAVGSQSNSTQTQTGNNSTAHLAGNGYPLSGKATSVAYDAMPSLTLSSLCSFIEVNVTNNSGSPLTVTSVTFTAPEDIIGTYYIDFTDPSDVKYVKSGNSYVSNTATLTVASGEAIANGAGAKFYLGVKPFNTKAGDDIVVSVNGYDVIINTTKDFAFQASKIKTVNFNYDYNPVDYEEATFVFNTTAGLSDLSITAPGTGSGTNLNGTDATLNDITLDFAKGTAGTDIRVWNSSGTYDLRTYANNSITVSAPSGYNVVKIVLSGSSVNNWTASTGTFSSGTWVGSSSPVVLTANNKGNINTIYVKCKKAASVPTINDASVNDVPVQGQVGLTKDIVMANFASAPELTATPDNTVITAASVGGITTTGATVTYTLSPNTSGAARVGTIVVSDGVHSGTITVNQPADVFSVTKTSVTLNAGSGASTTLTVKSDYDWTLVDDLISGFTVTPTSFTYSGSQSQTVTITATGSNATASPVELGAFTLKRTIDNHETETITVSQASAKLAAPVLSLTPDSANKKFTVSWTAVTNASKYEYYVLDGSANYKVSATQTADASTLSFEVTGINYDEEYTVAVKTVGNGSPWIDSDEAIETITVTEGAKVEEIDLTDQGFSNGDGVTNVNGTVVSLAFDKSSGSNAPKYYTSGTSVRTYANNTLTVSVGAGKTITKIEFTLGSTKTATISASTGTLGDISGSSRTWTGSSNSVVFTNGASGQMHYQKVKVTYE